MRDDVVKMAPFLVEDSKAGAFYVLLEQTEPARAWIRSLDLATGQPQPSTRLTAAIKTSGHLVAIRSFDLQDGDEIIRVGGRPVADLKRAEVLRALLSSTNPQPVSVQVRGPGSKQLRSAEFVLHSKLKEGTKVPRGKK